ncbi:hypothetical protein Pcinc_043234 [Petrolisthes cinctipes]|uniref:Uncharacterized protein n=1 Tax=Petrolisthes cinctipes TaxID=88211 RepID=A0AAE1EGA4_PETCI|nr:hypothetical protein Pcinc_043234 [Petrolisthes cinctipes]
MVDKTVLRRVRGGVGGSGSAEMASCSWTEITGQERSGRGERGWVVKGVPLSISHHSPFFPLSPLSLFPLSPLVLLLLPLPLLSLSAGSPPSHITTLLPSLLPTSPPLLPSLSLTSPPLLPSLSLTSPPLPPSLTPPPFLSHHLPTPQITSPPSLPLNTTSPPSLPLSHTSPPSLPLTSLPYISQHHLPSFPLSLSPPSFSASLATFPPFLHVVDNVGGKLSVSALGVTSSE